MYTDTQTIKYIHRKSESQKYHECEPTERKNIKPRDLINLFAK